MLLSHKTGQPAKPIAGFRFPRVRHGGNLVWAVEFTPQDVEDYLDLASATPYVPKGEPSDYGLQARNGSDKTAATGYAPAGNLDVAVSSDTAPNPTVSPAVIDNTGWVDGYKSAALAISHDGDETHEVTVTVTDPATGISGAFTVLVGPTLQTAKAGPSKVFRGEQTMTSSEKDSDPGHHSAENFLAVQRGAFKGMIASGTLVAPGSGENESAAVAERYVREGGETFDARARAVAGCTPFDLRGKTKEAARVWVKGNLYAVTKKLDGTFEWSKRDFTQILGLKFSEDPAAYPRGSAIRDAVHALPDAELRLSRANVQVAAAGGTPENPRAGDVWIEVPASVVNNRHGDTLYLWSYIKTLWLPYEQGVFKNPEGGDGKGYTQVYFDPLELAIARPVTITITEIPLAISIEVDGFGQSDAWPPTPSCLGGLTNIGVLQVGAKGSRCTASTPDYTYQDYRVGIGCDASMIQGVVTKVELVLTQLATGLLGGVPTVLPANPMGWTPYFGVYRRVPQPTFGNTGGCEDYFDDAGYTQLAVKSHDELVAAGSSPDGVVFDLANPSGILNPSGRTDFYLLVSNVPNPSIIPSIGPAPPDDCNAKFVFSAFKRSSPAPRLKVYTISP